MNKSYSYGALHQNNGNVVSIINNKDSNRTQSFTYDPLNRITAGWTTANTGTLSWGENYTIDAWGNLQINPMGGKAHGGYLPNASTALNQMTGMGYDAAGNMTSYTAPNQYSYDPENRIQLAGGMTYTYDADGNRVKKASGSTGTLYWYSSVGVIAETDLTGATKSEYVFFGGKRVARIDAPGNTLHYYLSDHLNSTSMIVSASGTVEEESDYSPYGSEYVVTAGPNHYKFTGKERDSESGNDYFEARYYGSNMGRFMSPDWNALPAPVPFSDVANPQSLNLYAYVRNNALSLIDPDGHDCVYLNNAGNGVESIDHNSSAGECKNTGGSWAEGNVDKSNVAFDKGSDQVLIGSNLSLTTGGISGNLTVATPGQASNTSGSAIRDFLARGPDFVQFSVSVGIPMLLNLAGPTANLTLDRNANVYFSPGAAFGKTITQVSGSLTANELLMRNKPSPAELTNFLKGFSFSFTGGYWGGAQIGVTPGAGYSLGVGVVSPQVGFAFTWGFKLGTIGPNGRW